MLAPAGPEARELARLGWFVLLVFVAITVVMCVLICWVAMRKRGTLAEHAPWDAPNDKSSVFFGGPNEPGYLNTWIVHAQSLKPRAQMPDIGGLSGEDLQALTHYLEELK